jgi:hypothetical protein
LNDLKGSTGKLPTTVPSTATSLPEVDNLHKSLGRP